MFSIIIGIGAALIAAIELFAPDTGAADRLARFVMFMFFATIALSAFTGDYKYDDTDDRLNKKRSGMRIYTDHRTGVQYLKAGPFGGTTVRVDEDGKPILARDRQQ